MSSGIEEVSGPQLPLQTQYTTFTSRQKRLLIVLLSLANLASPLTATIYLPLLPLLQVHFRVSLQAINLTITLYILFQAISPILFASTSDSFGRRPVILMTFSLYTLASIGLVLNRHSYTGLLILRALQSLGASAIQAVTYGVIADVCVPAERGNMQGPIIGMSNPGVNLGPFLGGLLSYRSGDFAWAFWGLVMFGGLSLLILGSFLNETARSVVGNGCRTPEVWWSQTWWTALGTMLKTGSRTKDQREKQPDPSPRTRNSADVEDHGTSWRHALKSMNIWAPIRILFHKDTSLILWMAASAHANYYCIQTSHPPIYKDIYHFNELQIGLSYLPGGVGVVLGSFANGKWMDRNYAITARKIGHEIDRVAGDGLRAFPIERARVRSCWYLLGLSMCAWVGYGWALERHTHVSVPLLLQFMHGVLYTCILQTFNALLVDIFPENPSAAATSGNITRCALSALFVALLQPIVNAIGRGWYFTLLGVVSGLAGGLLSSCFKHVVSSGEPKDSPLKAVLLGTMSHLWVPTRRLTAKRKLASDWRLVTLDRIHVHNEPPRVRAP